MKCEHVIKKLSAYIDGELAAPDREAVELHMEQCSGCREELEALNKQNEYIKDVPLIEPSTGFRARLWERLRDEKARQTLPWPYWLPIPAMSMLLLIIFIHLALFSTRVFAKSQSVKTGLLSYTVEHMAKRPNVLNPLTLINYCIRSHEYLCKCAQEQCAAEKCETGVCALNGNGGSNEK
jgi:hypothetical protein